MIKSNSGKIYSIPLDFEMGYTLGKFIDYTDVAPFDGALLYVLNKQFKDLSEHPAMEEVDKLGILFGPVPLNKYINEKGKGGWRSVIK